MKIPTVYQIIVERMYINSFKGRLSLAKAKNILGFIFRMPECKKSRIMKELQDMGLLEINGQRFVQLVMTSRTYKIFNEGENRL